MGKIVIEILQCDICDARSDEGAVVYPYKFSCSPAAFSAHGYVCTGCMATTLPTLFKNATHVKKRRNTLDEIIDLERDGLPIEGRPLEQGLH